MIMLDTEARYYKVRYAFPQFSGNGNTTSNWGFYETLTAAQTAEEKCRKVHGEAHVWIETSEGVTVNGSPGSIKQQPPIPSDGPAIWELVRKDMESRDQTGRAKYGQPLQPHNGRDGLVDLYQELLDAVAYTRQLIYERDGK